LEEVRAPGIHKLLYCEFALFFDREYIEPWLLATRESLGCDLWYEHRIDPDVVFCEKTCVEHSTFKPAISGDMIYYHPKIGFGPNDVGLSAAGAVEHAKKVLESFRGNNIFRLPLFLDQFNFKINNPDYLNMDRISDQDVPEILEGLVPVFRETLAGYGVWGYRDWRNDKIFNGSFELGGKGWNGSGFEIEEREDGYWAALSAGGEISQHASAPRDEGRCAIEFSVIGESAQLEITNGGGEATLHDFAAGQTSAEIVFAGRGEVLTIRCKSGAVRLKKIAYFSHVFTNGMRQLDGSSTPTFDAVRRFNFRLLGCEATTKEGMEAD
jgi:hypothetical protein